ncbi:MAG: hypothetical protein QOE94_3189 [Mycobacterium sp.]|nr:hypothetical protein [Mycobacterium sp.]
MARGVASQAFGKERVEPAVWQLGDDGLHGRPSDLGAEDSMADVDEVGFAKGFGHPIVRSPQPVVLGDQHSQLIGICDSDFVTMFGGEVRRRCEVVEGTSGPDTQIVSRPRECRDVGDRGAKQQLVVTDAAVYVVTVGGHIVTQRIAMPIQHGIDDRVAGNDLHVLRAWRG